MDLDRRLLSTTVAHLDILAGIGRHDASEAAVRASSGSLRALLVERMLSQAWNAAKLGGPITIPTWRFTTRPGPGVVGYCGGAEILPGVPVSIGFNATLEQATLNLHDFCKQSRIIAGLTTISTVELVQYVSNTMGGAHWDPGSRRKSVSEELRRLDSGEDSPIPMLVNGRNLLHHEVLSLVQAVLGSPEIARLRAAISG
jgi:hypothetical protein